MTDESHQRMSRQPPKDYDNRMYDDRYTSTRNHRESPSPRRYNPSHDRSRGPPRNGHGRDDYPDGRDWDSSRDLYHDRHTRGRSPRRPNHRGGYRDRDREDYRSDSRSRSRSRSRRRSRSPFYGGPPSREIMMDDLPLDLVEEDIRKELQRYHNVEDLDDVRIIRDRQTKASRGFGFLRFPSVEKAKAFLEPNFPTIYLYGNDQSDGNDKAAKVRIAFSREREDKFRGEKGDGEWVCKICTFANFPGRRICFKCHAPYETTAYAQTVQTREPEFTNSGDSDASPEGTPSQFLLVRNLEPTVTEELLAKGVSKLYKPNPNALPAAPSSKKAQAKVASTTGDANLGAREGSIRRVLLVRDRRTDESWRYGFAEFSSVEDAQAAVIRFNSYEKFTISSKPVNVSYVHAGVFVPVFDFVNTPQQFIFSPSGNAAAKLQYWDENAYVSELLVSKPEEDKLAKAGESRSKSAADLAAAAAAKEGIVETGEEVEAKSKKRKTETKDQSKPKKTTPAHLQFWSNRHAELHGVKKSDSGHEESNESHSDGNDVTSEPKVPRRIQSYADLNKKCCYLCSRQFKTVVEVNKHERISQLHRDNLGNEDLKAKAVAKMTKAGIHINNAEEDGPGYRDRAKERRAAFGASKRVSLPMKKPAILEPTSASTPVPSKGAALLGKMGWAAGEGLGAEGQGMTAPIATDIYVAGVGLGALGGKLGDAIEEASRNTKGDYGEFLERTKDRAKERYEKMS